MATSSSAKKKWRLSLLSSYILSCCRKGKKEGKIHVIIGAEDDQLPAKTNKEPLKKDVNAASCNPKHSLKLSPFDDLRDEENIETQQQTFTNSSSFKGSTGVAMPGTNHDYFFTQRSKKVHRCSVSKNCSSLCVEAPPLTVLEDVINMTGIAEEDGEAVLYIRKTSELKSATIEARGETGAICRIQKLVQPLNIISPPLPRPINDSNRSSRSCQTTLSDLTKGFSDWSSYDSSPFLNKELPRKQQWFVLDDGDSTSSQEEATEDKRCALPQLNFHRKSFEIHHLNSTSKLDKEMKVPGGNKQSPPLPLHNDSVGGLKNSNFEPHSKTIEVRIII